MSLNEFVNRNISNITAIFEKLIKRKSNEFDISNMLIFFNDKININEIMREARNNENLACKMMVDYFIYSSNAMNLQKQNYKDKLAKMPSVQNRPAPAYPAINSNNNQSSASASTQSSAPAPVPVINPVDAMLLSTSLNELIRVLNIDSLTREISLLFDSRYQNASNKNTTNIEYSIITDLNKKKIDSGAIYSPVVLEDIIEMEICPFSIPKIKNSNNYYGKITMSILELSNIGVDTYENMSYHFIFKTTESGNLIKLEPLYTTYKFYRPIPRIDRCTFVFGSPLSPIAFDNDRLYTKAFEYTSADGKIEFNEPHRLLSGDIIYIKSFTTLSPAADVALIEEINKVEGHEITQISETKISIGVNFANLNSPDANLSILIYFGAKRIMVPLKFKYLVK